MTVNASKTDLLAGTRRRYLALWFPFLPSDRLRRERALACEEPDERPLVFTQKIGGALKLFHCDRKATSLGLAPGLTLADARARIPDLNVVEADPERDEQFVLHLAAFFDRISPLIALDPPYGLMIDITGCAHLFGGEGDLYARLNAWTGRYGLAAFSVIAGTPDAARALVRFGKPGIVAPGDDAAATRPLPVAALEASDETRLALSRAGLKRLADVADRPSKALSARFGRGLATKLGRILGAEDRRISPLRAPPDCSVAVHFAEPVLQADALMEALMGLAERAAHSLEQQGKGGRSFEASFFRADGAVRRVTVETALPSRAAASILRLFKERLDSIADPIDPGFGFDIIRLEVRVSEPLAHAQQDLSRRAADDEAVADLIARLAVRLGRERVHRFVEEDTHNPQRSVSQAPALDQAASTQVWSSPEAGEPPSRPIQIFEPPQRIEVNFVDVPDGPPKQFRWRRVLHVIDYAEGPERISPEWWRADRAGETHDYYRVEDEGGRRFWIFRAGILNRETAAPEWFLRGVFA